MYILLFTSRHWILWRGVRARISSSLWLVRRQIYCWRRPENSVTTGHHSAFLKVVSSFFISSILFSLSLLLIFHHVSDIFYLWLLLKMTIPSIQSSPHFIPTAQFSPHFWHHLFASVPSQCCKHFCVFPEDIVDQSASEGELGQLPEAVPVYRVIQRMLLQCYLPQAYSGEQMEMECDLVTIRINPNLHSLQR